MYHHNVLFIIKYKHYILNCVVVGVSEAVYHSLSLDLLLPAIEMITAYA